MDGIIDSIDMSLSGFWEVVKDKEAWHAAVYGVAKSRTWLSNWTTIKYYSYMINSNFEYSKIQVLLDSPLLFLKKLLIFLKEIIELSYIFSLKISYYQLFNNRRIW